MMTDRASIFGLGDEPIPQRVIPERKLLPSTPVETPTRKSAFGGGRADDQLMELAVMHLDTDPTVVRIEFYPATIEFDGIDRRGRRTRLRHIPDLGIRMHDGMVRMIDVVPLWMLAERPRIGLRADALKRALQDDFGVEHQLWDERHLMGEPRRSNVRILAHHRPEVIDEPARKAVRVALLELGLPTTIEAVRRAAALPPVTFRHADDGKEIALSDVDPAFSTVLEFHMAGEIALDLDRPLDDAAVISRGPF